MFGLSAFRQIPIRRQRQPPLQQRVDGGEHEGRHAELEQTPPAEVLEIGPAGGQRDGDEREGDDDRGDREGVRAHLQPHEAADQREQQERADRRDEVERNHHQPVRHAQTPFS